MGGGNYQTLINDALCEYIRGARLEKMVRQAVREEVRAFSRTLARTAKRRVWGAFQSAR
jgi:hypothetical protein